MVYPNLRFPAISKRPFFYTNFVQTLDGKVRVKKMGYWPIGSRVDHQVLTELRAYADCLVHGGNLAREFGEVTLNSLDNTIFKKLRVKLGKNQKLPYYVVTRKFKNLRSHLRGVIVKNSVQTLLKDLNKNGYKNVLVEGGPTLLGSFLKENLIDEIFLTIAPKIYGTQDKTTLTLVEGVLFSPPQIKKLKLVFCKKLGNELFLRYKIIL